jgi:hypothetical protein
MGEKVWPWQVQSFVSRLASEQAMTGPHEHGVFGCCRHCGAEDSSITLEECQSMGPVHHVDRISDFVLLTKSAVLSPAASRSALRTPAARAYGRAAERQTQAP